MIITINSARQNREKEIEENGLFIESKENEQAYEHY
jgi:hypothetical protein